MKKKKKNALTLNLWITLPHFPLHIDTEWTLKYLQAEIGSSVCRHPLPTMKGWGQREWEGEGVQGEVGVQGSHYSSETTNWTTMRCKEWSHSNHVPRTGITLESSGCSQRLARDEGATVWGGEGARGWGRPCAVELHARYRVDHTAAPYTSSTVLSNLIQHECAVWWVLTSHTARVWSCVRHFVCI